MEKYNRRIMVITGAVIIFLLVFFHMRVVSSDNGVVASIGDEQITWADFIAFAAGINEPVTDDQRIQLLDNLVMQRLAQIYVQRDPALRDSLHSRFEREQTYAYRMLLSREVERYMVRESVYISHAELQRFFDEHNVISLYALYASRVDPTAQARMDSARVELLLGHDREEVISRFSDLPDAAFFGYYVQGLDANFDRIAPAESLAMTGSVSEVFPSDYGPMLLVRGSDPSLEEASATLRDILVQRYLGRGEMEFTEGLLASFEVNDSLLALATQGAAIAPSEVVIRYRQSGFAIDWRRFSDILRDLYYIESPGRVSLPRLLELARVIADQEKRLQLAEELGLAGTLRFRLRWEGLKQSLAQDQDEKTFKYVQEKMAPVSSEEMRAWFADHKEQFRQSDFFQLQQIVTDSHEKAEEAWKRAMAGEDFSTLVRELSMQPGYTQDGVVGLTALRDKNTLGAEYDSLAAHAVSDILPPAPYETDRWRVARIFKRVPGAIRPYDTVQPFILRKLQMEKWRVWLDGLSSEDSLHVETHYDVLLKMQFPPSRQVNPQN